MTGRTLPAPATVSVSVLNGTGAYDQATDHLRRPGRPRVPHRGHRGHPVGGRQSETVVYYAAKTPADQAAAQAVARSLSGAVVTGLGPTSDGAQVTVVTGTQFSVSPPPTAPAATGPTAPAARAAAGPSPRTPPRRPPRPRRRRPAPSSRPPRRSPPSNPGTPGPAPRGAAKGPELTRVGEHGHPSSGANRNETVAF